MDGLLEANRIIEASYCKLSHVSKGRELSLRKALLVSNTLSKAQETAEIVQMTFMRCDPVSARSSSKLLASMQSNSIEDKAVNQLDLDAGHVRLSQKSRQQPVSPMVTSVTTTQCSVVKDQDDVMDFISRSVLSDILDDSEIESSSTSNKIESPITTCTTSQDVWTTSGPLMTDISNIRSWSCWETPSMKFSSHWYQENGENRPPLSPGKRHHNIAFPVDQDQTTSFTFGCEDSKRFKASIQESTTMDSLCDHLSPEQLCSTPLITYMFGKGFTSPFNNPSIFDWPSFGLCTTEEGSFNKETEVFSHIVSPSKLLPVLAY